MQLRHLAPLVLAAGCLEHLPHDVATVDAEDDLNCGAVTLEELSSTLVPLPTVDYRATGCFQTSRYQCIDHREHPGDDYVCTMVAHTRAASNVTIDSLPLIPDGDDLCRSGNTDGQAFYGVDLTSPGGDTLRLLRNPDLSFAVLAIAATGDHSPPMTDCATVTIGADPLAGLAGDATIACTSGSWTVDGEITFQGCE